MASSPWPTSVPMVAMRWSSSAARIALAIVCRGVSAACNAAPAKTAQRTRERSPGLKTFIIEGRTMNARDVPRKRGGRCLSTRPASFCVSALSRQTRGRRSLFELTLEPGLADDAVERLQDLELTIGLGFADVDVLGEVHVLL